MITQLLFALFVFFLFVSFNNSAQLEQRYRAFSVYVKCYCFLTANMCVHCRKDFFALCRLIFQYWVLAWPVACLKTTFVKLLFVFLRFSYSIGTVRKTLSFNLNKSKERINSLKLRNAAVLLNLIWFHTKPENVKTCLFCKQMSDAMCNIYRMGFNWWTQVLWQNNLVE